MEVPAKLRSALVGFRYWLFAFLLLAAASLLAGCSGGETTTVIVLNEDIGSIILTIENDSLVAGGFTTTIVRAEVFKFDGSPVPDNTTVHFTVTPIGDIPATAPTRNGVATVMLTSDTTAGQYYITATAGDVGQIAFGEFVAGAAASANTTLSANPDSIDPDGISTSLITLIAYDAFNNPISDGTTVNFYTNEGVLSSPTGTTENGIATVTLTSSLNDNTIATVTAVAGPITKTVKVGFGTVVIIGEGTGTANTISLKVSANTIRVKNSGGNETTVIEAIAKDGTNSPITNCAPLNNIRFEIINGPGGGEKLDGIGSFVEKSTDNNGRATVTLSSGIVSGTVNVQVSVILNGDCTVTDPDLPAAGYYATAFTSKIAIEAGEPANINIFQDNLVTANDDGSISRTVSALVQDLHGNPVENGTVVFFGLVDNPDPAGPPYLGYKSSGINGVTNKTMTFTSAGNSFVSDGLMAEDILIILEGADEGGHRIQTVNNNTSLTLYNTMNASETGLNFVAGSAELGTVCGSVQTGNLEMDSSCIPTTVGGVGSIKGVAHSKLTWVPQGIFKPFHLYAESVGGNVGDTLAASYPAVAPVSATLTIAPAAVASGSTGISVIAEFKDGAGNPIQGEDIVFSSSNVGVAFVSGPNPVATGSSGKAGTTINTTSCLAENASVTITAALGSFTATGSLSVSATAPTANFTFTTTPEKATYSDTSTTPAGTTLNSWSWVFSGGSPGTSSSSVPPQITYAGGGTFQTTLTVRNNAGCTSAPVSKGVTVPAPPAP